jgi:PAS domain S-box-containing protein
MMNDGSDRYRQDEELEELRRRVRELERLETVHSETENVLWDLEERYRLLYEYAGDAIYTYDTALTLIAVNRKACELIGYEEGELLGRNVLELGILHPEDFEKVTADIRRLFEGEEVVRDEFRFVKSTGEVALGEVVGALLYDRSGNVIAVTNIVRDITERALEDMGLREREAYFRRLIENVSDIVTILDANGNILYESPAYERILGFSPDEMVGRSALEFLHPDDVQPMARVFFGGVEEPGVSIKAEFRLRHMDGSWRTFEAVGRNLLEDPMVRGVVINSRDVTERRTSEQALRESEERYRMLVETSPDCISLSDLTGKIIMTNRGGLALLGVSSPSEIIGRTVLDFIAPEDRERAVRSMRVKPDSGFSRTEEYTLLKQDGTRFPGEICASLLTGADGKPRGYISITRDITERSRAEETLRASEERYRTVFESTGTAMCIVEEDLTLSFVNHEFRSVLGRGPQEVEGKRKFTDFLLEEDREAFDSFRRNLVESGGEVSEHLGCRMRDRFGEVLFVLVSMGLIPGTGNTVISLIDISREKGYENALEGTASQLRDFLSVASHELRHPITIIKGYIQLLEELVGDTPIAQLPLILHSIDQAADRLDRLGDELLDISRIEERRFSVSKVPEELQPLLEQAVSEMGGGAGGGGYVVDMKGEAMLVEVDREKFIRLMVILLDNASKFSPPDSPIEILSEWGTGEVMISVMDRGTGVPEGSRERIFERFYQVDDVLHHSKPGLGLGLYIAQEIVERHGGSIWYEPREGGGSIFRFTLRSGSPAD